MNLSFFKYQGAGNDFILIDNRENSIDKADSALFRRLCDRKFGIGADGLMLLGHSSVSDFDMFYTNSDGMPGSMCGNGGRCIVAFAKKLGIISDHAVFSAADGLHSAKISGMSVSLHMKDVEKVFNYGHYWIADTGSPHYITLSENLDTADVYALGKEVRNSDPFREKGINVNFVQKKGQDYHVRTFERGVENETLACGTGVTAVALAMAESAKAEGNFITTLHTPGGILEVQFTRNNAGAFSSVFLKGAAEFVFEGQISI